MVSMNWPTRFIILGGNSRPDNFNIKYKIGNCYLNIFDEKPKAIPFLEEAVRSTSYNSKTGKLKETRAP